MAKELGNESRSTTSCVLFVLVGKEVFYHAVPAAVLPTRLTALPPGFHLRSLQLCFTFSAHFYETKNNIYSYQPFFIMTRFTRLSLDDGCQEIRLIHLLPGAFDDDIQVEIFHEPLSEERILEYEALSYVWGL
jgi:hypothetical protein